MTVVQLPNRLKVNPQSLPNDFDDLVRASFAEYTEGTSRDYTYTDKLGYIDLCVRYVNGIARDYPEDIVKELMKHHFEHELSEYGRIADTDDFKSIEFMQACYEQGTRDQRLKITHAYRFDDRRDAEAIEKMMCRVISIVMSYEKPAPACQNTDKETAARADAPILKSASDAPKTQSLALGA